MDLLAFLVVILSGLSFFPTKFHDCLLWPKEDTYVVVDLAGELIGLSFAWGFLSCRNLDQGRILLLLV